MNETEVKSGFTTSEGAATLAHLLVTILGAGGFVASTDRNTLEGAVSAAIVSIGGLIGAGWVIVHFIQSRAAVKQAALAGAVATTSSVTVDTSTTPAGAPAASVPRGFSSGKFGGSVLPLVCVMLFASTASAQTTQTCFARRHCPPPAPAPQQIIQQQPQTDPAVLMGLQRIGDTNAQLLAALQAQQLKAVTPPGGCTQIHYHYHSWPASPFGQPTAPGTPVAPVAPVTPVAPQLAPQLAPYVHGPMVLAAPPPILIQPPQQVLPINLPPQQHLPINLPPQQVLPINQPPQQLLPINVPPQQVLPINLAPQQTLPIQAAPQQTLPQVAPPQQLLPQAAPQQQALPIQQAAPQQTLPQVPVPQQQTLPLSPQVSPQQQLLSAPPAVGYQQYARVQWRRVQ